MSDETGKVAKTENRQGGLRKLVGAVLSLIGLFWLAHKAGWIPADHGQPAVFWPVLLIIAGIMLFFSIGHRNRHSP